MLKCLHQGKDSKDKKKYVGGVLGVIASRNACTGKEIV